MKEISYPKLSIITINLNDKTGLRRTIESVVNQVFKEFEFIIIDGASTDGSVEVIEEYKNQITYQISEKDTGIYHAMNKGIKVARGEYLLFLNSGDWLFDNVALGKAFELIDPEAAVCSADLYLDDGKTLKYFSNPLIANFSFFKRAHLTHQSTFIKREMFEKNGLYNESFKISSDWEFFFFVLIVKGEKYQKISSILSVFNTYGISQNESMKVITEDERQKAIDQYISKPLQLELLELEVAKMELSECRGLKKKMEERRYRLMGQIEKSKLLRGLLTIQMMVLSKLANIFSKK